MNIASCQLACHDGCQFSEVDLAQVSLEAAPPNDRHYANKLLGFQVTGGSNSIRATWEPLRRAGATARVMLVTAAARGWNVDPATCDAKQGTVIHGETGRKQPYAALIDVAATLPVPTDVMLKDSKQIQADRDARKAARYAGQGER